MSQAATNFTNAIAAGGRANRQANQSAIQAQDIGQDNLLQLVAQAQTVLEERQRIKEESARLAQQARQARQAYMLERQQQDLTKELGVASINSSNDQAILSSQDRALDREASALNTQAGIDASSELQTQRLNAASEDSALDRVAQQELAKQDETLKRDKMEQDLLLAKEGDRNAQLRLEKQLTAERNRDAKKFSNDKALMRLQRELEAQEYKERLEAEPLAPEEVAAFSQYAENLGENKPEQLQLLLAAGDSKPAAKKQAQKLVDLEVLTRFDNFDSIADEKEMSNEEFTQLLELASPDVRQNLLNREPRTFAGFKRWALLLSSPVMGPYAPLVLASDVGKAKGVEGGVDDIMKEVLAR